MRRQRLEEDALDDRSEEAKPHDFHVTAVEPASSEGRIAVTLVDIRGGRVTLHLDEPCATLLRDMIDDQLI